MADIYISDKRRRRVLRLPLIPEDFPEIAREAASEEFIPISGKPISILKKAGLRSFTLAGKLPTKPCSYAKSAVMAEDVIHLIETAMESKQPLRIVLSGRTYTGMLASAESFSYSEQRSGFVVYSVSFKEWRG